MTETIVKMPFSANGWGCRSLVKNLADTYDLEWIWKSEGGSFIFEHIEGKVRGKLKNIEGFRDTLEQVFD